jgi:hypothetical protein
MGCSLTVFVGPSPQTQLAMSANSNQTALQLQEQLCGIGKTVPLSAAVVTAVTWYTLLEAPHCGCKALLSGHLQGVVASLPRISSGPPSNTLLPS